MLRPIPFLAAILIAAGLSVGLWAWLGRSVEIVDVPNGHIQCLSYTPATDGASPLEAKDGIFHVPEGRIAADMIALAPYTDCVRTYSMLGSQGDVLPAAAAAGIKVLVGIWIGADDERNEREIARALELAHAYPDAVRGIVVGNEVLLRREMTGERLARIVRSVKARTDLPVTYADIYEFWRRNPVVAEAVDIVTVHVLPYWDDPHPVTIDEVQAHVRTIIDTARKTFPGKTLQIGEIGWPSAGRTRAGAVPTLVNEARFVREFAAQATAIGVPYNLIEAIDQPWKRVPEGTVGGFWGILDTDRNLKFPLTGPVSEWPRWPLAAGFTAAVAALVLGWAALRRRSIGCLRWLTLGVAGPAIGASLWALGAQMDAVAIGWKGDAWTAFLLALTGLCGAMLARVIADPPDRLRRTASLGDLLAACAGQRPWDAAARLALLHWCVMLPAAILTLALAIDGRHRDFLTLAFWIPGAAFLLLSLRTRALRDPSYGARPEEGWIAALLLLTAPFAVDAPNNAEAWAWAATCVLLALPWLSDALAEAGRLRRAFRSARPHDAEQR